MNRNGPLADSRWSGISSMCVMLLAAAVFLSAGRVACQDGSPMNILLIISDDYGWADLRANNERCFYDTPALDRLASEGANFEQAYATNPVCSPSRVSIMTGRYPTWTDTTTWFWTKPHRNENYRTAEYVNQLPLDEITIADVLGDAGYRTMFAGKWHLGHERDRWPDRRGFDVNIGGSGIGSPGKAGYFAPFHESITGLEGVAEGAFLPEVLTDSVLEYIAEPDERPFFVTLSYYHVHTPLEGRDDLVEKYQIRSTAMGYADGERFGEEEQVWDRVRERVPFRPVRERQDHAVYAAMVEAQDEQIGRVLDELERLGLDKRTLVIFTSDHGGLSTAEGSPTSNLPLRGGKGWIYEGGLRVPLLVRWPGVTRANSLVRTPSIGNDLFATMVDAAELDTAARASHTDGVSLRAALMSSETLVREPFFWHYPHYANQGGFPAAAVRLGRWKLIQRLEDGCVHLFDLDSDLGERVDVSDERRAVVADLLDRLHTWQRRSEVKFLRPKKNGPMPWRPKYARDRDHEQNP